MTEFQYAGVTSERKPCQGSVRAPDADTARLRQFVPDIEAVPLRDGLAATVDWYRTLPDYRG